MGGPRAERPEIAADYEEKLPEFALRLQCKAGLTGYAQVYGKYNTTPYDKLLMDLMYILYDVKVGNNVIIGAGSLVNKDIPGGVVAAGVPCKVIGSFEEYKNKVINQEGL